MMSVLVSIYIAVGVLFAAYFTAAGYKKLDASADGAGFGVRLLWLPAALVLWPVLFAKLLKGPRA